jgi:hypothetical protein
LLATRHLHGGEKMGLEELQKCSKNVGVVRVLPNIIEYENAG